MILNPCMFFFHQGPAAVNPLQPDKLYDCKPPPSTSPHETTLLLPQHLKVTVSNFQIPSRIMAISEQVILHPDYEKLKDNEKCSLLLVICNADSDTLQAIPLCVDLYEAGMKERNSTCYLSVNVNLQSANASQNQAKQPTFHIQKKTILEPGQIALQFSFSQPDVLYAISFSLHSIIDSEGIQVISCSFESSTYLMYTANCLPVYQDEAPVLGSGLPQHELTGPLRGSKYHQIVSTIKKKGLSGKIQLVQHFTNQFQESPNTSCDIKVVALVYAASFISLYNSSEMSRSKELLDKALKLSVNPDCQNSKLLEGMVFTYQAQALRVEGRYKEAQFFLDKAKVAYFDAAPSYLTSSVHYQQAMIYASQCGGAMTADVKQKVAQQLALMISHGQRSEGYDLQQRTIFGLTSKAMLHLNLFYPFHQHHQERVSPTDPKPSSEELQQAKACLDAVDKEHNKIVNMEDSIDNALYYLTLSEYYRFSDNYVQAEHNLEVAKKHAIGGNFNLLLEPINVRLALVGSPNTFEKILQNFL